MHENIESENDNIKSIVFKNYMPYLIYMQLVFETIIFEVIFIFNIFGLDEEKVMKGIIVFPFMLIPWIGKYNKTKHQTITLNENSIKLKDKNNQVINKIELSDIIEIKKTFQSYYSKEQDMGELTKVFYKLFFIISFPLQMTVEITNFVFRKLFTARTGTFNLHDSILIYSKDGTIFNLFIENQESFQEIDRYLADNFQKNIKDLETDFQYFYLQIIV